MNEFNYPYAYGKLNTAMFFLAGSLLKEGLIKEEQRESIQEFIDKKLKEVKEASAAYSNQ